MIGMQVSAVGDLHAEGYPHIELLIFAGRIFPLPNEVDTPCVPIHN